jgi:ribonuclease VapC
VPVTAEHVGLARSAWRQYGRGRHPAALNHDDRFAYALAASLGEPLLFAGEDFSRTDITPALKPQVSGVGLAL